MNLSPDACNYDRQEKVRQYWEEYCKAMREGLPRNYSLQNVENLIAHILYEHPNYEWRPLKSLAKDCGLSEYSLGLAIERMKDQGIVVQNPRNPDYWGVVSRVGRQQSAVPVLDPVTFEPRPQPDMFDALRECITQAQASIKVATQLVSEVSSWKIA